MLRSLILAFVLLFGAGAVRAQDFSLSAPEVLDRNGFLKFLLPRFSLKTRIRPALQIGGEDVDAALNTTSGTPIFTGLGQVFYIDLAAAKPENIAKAQRFADWLLSDIGKRTIQQFEIEGTAIFTAMRAEAKEEIIPDFAGDLPRGEALAFTTCARCHVINESNRMKGIGSAPSFGLLRSLPDWLERFQTFNERLPHPSIIRIIGVTEPFSAARPPSSRPVELTVAELADILTYIVTIQPIDLGPPLQQN